MIEGGQEALEALSEGALDPGEPVSLTELLGEVDEEVLTCEVKGALELALGGAWADGGYASAEVELAGDLVVERYGTDPWTWRR